MDTGRTKRFSVFRIIEHWVFMLTFVVLVITGLSQKYYTLDVSTWVIFGLGGIDYVRLTHHYAGLVFWTITSFHVICAVICIWSKKWQPTMVITKDDFSNLIHNIKYYLDMEKHPALCDRYNYRQKFAYWGVLISAFIMINTGLVLWFPAFFARFVSGEVIPAAQVIHTNHGLLIFLIIALWHVYNSIFSPEVFPVDKSMFTGYISRERMVREHPAELARIEQKTFEEIIDEYHTMEYHSANGEQRDYSA